jgi:calcineurin-like phosphoesterase family protein
MAIFFTADTHFGHAAARALYRRPFPSVAAMDEAMVARWNETVAPEDEIWHLGDFVVGPRRESVVAEAAASLLARLNGRKRLIIGNNDPPAVATLPGWGGAATHYAELEVDGVGVVLCHYAFRTWRNAALGWVNLHGHSHGRLRPPLPRQADVGVDAQGFRPVNLAQALEAQQQRRRRRA